MTDQAKTTVSDELRKECSPEWCAIYDTMRQHNLTNMVFVGSDDPFCLVDLVSTIGTDISTGEEQLLILADEISLALDARRATADVTEAGRELLEAAEAVFDWMNDNDLSADYSEQKPEDFDRISKSLVAFRAALQQAPE